MADCFWTDFVGCAEDCGTAPAVGPPVLLAGGSATGTDQELVPFLVNGDALPAGAMQLDTVAVYSPAADDPTGCNWGSNYYILTTDAALADTTWDDTAGSGYIYTWKTPTQLGLLLQAEGANVPLIQFGADQGCYSPPCPVGIMSSSLFTQIGGGDKPYGIVATLRNLDTGDTWEATCLLDTCY